MIFVGAQYSSTVLADQVTTRRALQLKFFQHSPPWSVRPRAISSPGNIQSLPQTKNSSRQYFQTAMGRLHPKRCVVYIRRTPGSRDGSAVVLHCGREKHPPTTGKSPKPIYLFRSLGPPRGHPGRWVWCAGSPAVACVIQR